MKYSAAAVALLTVISYNATARKTSVLPHVLVYKTRSNYQTKVPVLLSADRKKVISYPDPTDIRSGGANALPLLLHKGYLLDRRGVGTNTAFLKLSYGQYGALASAPTPDELYKMIKDANPLTELYDCGPRGDSNSEQSLNRLIDHKQLQKKCRRIK